MRRVLCFAIAVALCLPTIVQAGVKTKAAEEAAEYVMKKFGKEFAEEGIETLSRKIEVLAVKHGDEAITAVKKVGPKAVHVIEEAGEHGPQAVKLLAGHGDDALWVASKSNRLSLFARHGDDAAEAMIKQGELAEPLIESIGKPAASAFKTVSKQNGRRLAMLADDGTLKQIGRTDQVLGVVSKYGDRAMDFVWKNKGALTVAAALTAFLSNPEPFLDGTKDITKTLAENVAQPLANEAAKSINWPILLSVMTVMLGCFAGFKVWQWKR